MVMWDDMSFFGFALKKIPRLYGEKIKFTDTFYEPDTIAFLIITLVILLTILRVEFFKALFWSQKQQII